MSEQTFEECATCAVGYPCAEHRPVDPRRSQEMEIVARICVGVPLDNDAIPYEEGADVVDHLISLIRHEIEEAKDKAND